MIFGRTIPEVRETTDATAQARRQSGLMEVELTVLEAYLPDVAERDGRWSRLLVEQVNRTIAPHDLKAILLILPEDEAAFWLISARESSKERPAIPAGLDLAGLIGAATGMAGGRVAARRMGGHLVQPDSAGD